MQLAKMKQSVFSHTSNFRDTDFVKARNGATSIGQIGFSIALQKMREYNMKKKN